MSSRYEIQTVSPLPRISPSVTLAAALCGRADDAAFNAAIVQAVKRYDGMMHFSAAVYCFCCCTTFFVQDHTTAVALSIISLVFLLPTATLLLACHLRDPLLLTIQTYEFWFTTLLNASGFVCMSLLFSDLRILASVVCCSFCQIAFFFDGNLHTRRFIIRVFALASPLIGVALVAVAIRYTPGLRHTKINLGNGHEGDAIDAVVHCFTTMTIFLAVKVIRSRRLFLRSDRTIEAIKCDVYNPICHFVPVILGTGEVQVHQTKSRENPSQVALTRQRTSGKTSTQLEVIRQDSSIVVDSDDTPLARIGSQEQSVLTPWVNPVGIIGLVCSSTAFAWTVFYSSRSGEPTLSQLILSAIGVGATVIFILMYLLHSPLLMLKRLFHSLDAWFVSCQFSIVTIGACDVVMWDRRALMLLPPWLWCHCIMIADTFTPLTKRRVRFHRGFIRAVLAMLLTYPIVLIYWVFYSDAPRLQNRVLVSVQLFGSTLRMEAYSLLISRVWTAWLWMGRFLWRELFRPADAFKLLKYRVQYDTRSVGRGTTGLTSVHPVEPR